MLDGRFDRARCPGRRALILAQPRMKLIELPHLAIGPPTQIAVAGILQVHPSDLLEATGRVEAGGELIGQRLIVNKAAGASRADGLLVEPLGIEYPAFNPRHLRAHEGESILEVVRAVLRPYSKLSPVSG